MNRIRAFFGTARAKLLVVVSMVSGVLVGAAAPSFAQTAPTTYSPSQALTDTTNFAGTTFGEAAPIILAVAGAIVGLALLVWGVTTVLGKIRGRHTSGATL